MDDLPKVYILCLLKAQFFRVALSVPHKNPVGIPEKDRPYFQTQDAPSLGLQAVTVNHAGAQLKKNHTTTPSALDLTR